MGCQGSKGAETGGNSTANAPTTKTDETTNGAPATEQTQQTSDHQQVISNGKQNGDATAPSIEDSESKPTDAPNTGDNSDSTDATTVPSSKTTPSEENKEVDGKETSTENTEVSKEPDATPADDTNVEENKTESNDNQQEPAQTTDDAPAASDPAPE